MKPQDGRSWKRRPPRERKARVRTPRVRVEVRGRRRRTAARCCCAAAAAAVAQANVTVFAAASLKNALDEVNAAWKAETGKTATISYAASSALAKQIEEGAPADVFISADLDWMAYLSERDLIKKDTEVAAARQPHRAGRAGGFRRRPPRSRRASTSPACSATAAGHGQRRRGAGRQVRQGGARHRSASGTSVADKVAQAENVRAALALVSTGEAPLGIVYQTDAAADPRCEIVGTFPEDTPSADHLSRRRRPPSRDRAPTPRAFLELPAARRDGRRTCSRRRASRCWRRCSTELRRRDRR